MKKSKTNTNNNLKIFKVAAMGDTIYIRANDRDDAHNIFEKNYGDDLPSSFCKWSTVDKLPKGEEFIAGSR